MSTPDQPPSTSSTKSHCTNLSTALTLGVYAISFSEWFSLSPVRNSAQDAEPSAAALACTLRRQTQKSAFDLCLLVSESLIEREESWTLAVDGGDGRSLGSGWKVWGIVVERKEWASVRAEWRNVWRSGRDGEEGRHGLDGREVKGRGVR